jgi:hypothetical protein
LRCETVETGRGFMRNSLCIMETTVMRHLVSQLVPLQMKRALRRVLPWRHRPLNGIRVHYMDHLVGDGSTFGQGFVLYLLNRGMPKQTRTFEWCAGPGKRPVTFEKPIQNRQTSLVVGGRDNIRCYPVGKPNPALACSKPPKGYARWTLRLLENKVVELGIVDRASDSTIWRTLKKTLSGPIAASTGSSRRRPTARS